MTEAMMPVTVEQCEAVKLLACPNPWCVSTTRPMLMGTGLDQSERQWVIRCGCGVVTFRMSTEAEAIAAWNTRATPPSPAGLADSMAAILQAVEDEAYKVTVEQKPCRHTAALNTIHEIAEAALTANGSQPDRVVDVLRGCEGVESGPNGRGGMRVVAHFPTPGDETPLFVWLSTLDAKDQSND